MNKTTKKEFKNWDKKIIQISLHDEIYPNDKISRTFLLVTKTELRKLNKLTERRVKRYNKIKPKEWAGY